MASATAYLFFYNLAQATGWSYIGFLGARHLHLGEDPERLHDAVSAPLRIFQTLALLEVVHAATGLVRSNPVAALFQLASRVFLVWPILEGFSEARTSVGFAALLVAWTITEIIRYLFYALSLFKAAPFPLTYLRYTTFIVLYPLGVSGELLCVYRAALSSRASGKWSYPLPNPNNVSFAFDFFLGLVAVVYAVVFPRLYGYMFSQRGKALGSREKAE